MLLILNRNKSVDSQKFVSQVFRWVWLVKNGLWNLTELTYWHLQRPDLFWVISKLFKIINLSFITVEMVKIVKLLCIFVLNLVPKSQINPFMKMLTDNIWFQNISHLEDELFWTMGPWRKNHIVDFLLILFLPQVNVTAVFQELWPVVKLWGQLLHVTGCDQDWVELLLYGWKKSVGMVDSFALMLPVEMDVWL